MKKHIYFVRHGQSEQNLDGIHRGAEAVLTEEGVRQAELAAKRFSGLDIDTVISSAYTRARDTAAIIAKEAELKARENILFNEIELPSNLLGKHRDDEAVRHALEAMQSSTDPHYRHGDEETFAEFSARAHRALEFLEASDAERICVVTHGAFLRALFGAIVLQDRFTREQFTLMFNHLFVRNTGVVYAQHVPEEDKWRLITWNDQAHLG